MVYMKGSAMTYQYIVDPRLVVDILEGDSEWGVRSARLMDRYRNHRLLIAPNSYLALGPAFMGMRSLQDAFLANLGISVTQKFPIEVMDAAYKAWCAYNGDHPGASGPGSAFDSLYIGAIALLYDGIITRQGDLYRRYYPSLPVIEPSKG